MGYHGHSLHPRKDLVELMRSESSFYPNTWIFATVSLSSSLLFKRLSAKLAALRFALFFKISVSKLRSFLFCLGQRNLSLLPQHKCSPSLIWKLWHLIHAVWMYMYLAGVISTNALLSGKQHQLVSDIRLMKECKLFREASHPSYTLTWRAVEKICCSTLLLFILKQ